MATCPKSRSTPCPRFLTLKAAFFLALVASCTDGPARDGSSDTSEGGPAHEADAGAGATPEEPEGGEVSGPSDGEDAADASGDASARDGSAAPADATTELDAAAPQQDEAGLDAATQDADDTPDSSSESELDATADAAPDAGGPGAGDSGDAAGLDSGTELADAGPFFSVRGGLSPGTEKFGFVLTNNGKDPITVNATGSLFGLPFGEFTFPRKLALGETYNVAIAQLPPRTQCSVDAAAGTIAGDVTNVLVICQDKPDPKYFSVGGVASLAPGVSVTLQNNAGDDLTLSSSGSFTFPTKIVQSASYNVTVRSHTPGVACQVFRGGGTPINNVNNVLVVCGRQVVFAEWGTHSWTVPDGVTSVSVMAVGGGGGGGTILGNDPAGGGGGELCYRNDIAVVSGSTIAVVVGAGGSAASYTPPNPNSPGSSTFPGDGAASRFGDQVVANGGKGWTFLKYDPISGRRYSTPGAGGAGGVGQVCFAGGSGGSNNAGGGAAGYQGKGGNAVIKWTTPTTAATNGSGGGGAGAAEAGNGGCVGVNGQGADGVVGASGGAGSAATELLPSGVCVGGGGGLNSGAGGAVRIIWGGGRAYPSTRTQDE